MCGFVCFSNYQQQPGIFFKKHSSDAARFYSLALSYFRSAARRHSRLSAHPIYMRIFGETAYGTVTFGLIRSHFHSHAPLPTGHEPNPPTIPPAEDNRSTTTALCLDRKLKENARGDSRYNVFSVYTDNLTKIIKTHTHTIFR